MSAIFKIQCNKFYLKLDVVQFSYLLKYGERFISNISFLCRNL